MKYMGSKNRIVKEILPIMLNSNNTAKKFYDVCCGGANLIDKVPNSYERIAVDNNEYLIEALKIIKDNPEILPKNKFIFTEKDYKAIRKEKDKYPKWLVGYTGFALSWGGKWFGGYCRDGKDKRDYVNEAYRNAIKQSKRLKDVEFLCASYDKIQYDKNSIIYIDPPYKNTTKYKDDFDHNKFWNWVRTMSKNGFTIFVSEYVAPCDFEVVWQKPLNNSLKNISGKGDYNIEKLFTYIN